MKNRIVENWLTKANELAYQVPFSQLLLSKKHKLLHKTRHGPFEQGKDLIAISPEGVPCGYQLKKGNISATRWRKEVYPEIVELVEIPMVHPSIKSDTPHENYLVTNGELSEEVRRAIDDLNKGWVKRGFNPLNTIVMGELVKDFQDYYGDYIPADIPDLSSFLTQMLEDGVLPLDKEKLALLLESILPINENPSSYRKSNSLQVINASVVITSYVLQNKMLSENHIAVIEGWVVLLSYIFLMVEKFSLAEKYWKDSVDLVFDAIENQYALLCEELSVRKHYVEGSALEDVFVYKTRVSIVAGFLTAWALRGMISAHEDTNFTECTDKFIKETFRHYRLFGEYITPHLTNVSLFKFYSGDEAHGEELLNALLLNIVGSNVETKTEGIPNPYYDGEKVIEWLYGLTKKNTEESFKNISYSLRTLLLLLANRNSKALIEENWVHISNVQFAQYTPENKWEYFRWRNRDSGNFDTRFPKKEQSWKELVEVAQEDYSKSIPSVFEKYPEFIPLWLSVFPHRYTPEVVLFLDNLLKSKFNSE